MTASLESSLKQFIREVVHEVAAALMEELRTPTRQHLPQPIAQDASLLLTARETAKRLAISERHLHGLTRSGQISCVRVGTCVRYSVETIQKWLRETESTDQPSSNEQIKSKPTPPPPGPAAPVPKPQLAQRRKRRVTKARAAVPERQSPNVSERKSNSSPQQKQSEERISPFSVLLSELGIDRSDLPPITNGDLRRIAEVDIATMHGWLYLGRSLPEEAMNKLRNHFVHSINPRKQ